MRYSEGVAMPGTGVSNLAQCDVTRRQTLQASAMKLSLARAKFYLPSLTRGRASARN